MPSNTNPQKMLPQGYDPTISQTGPMETQYGTNGYPTRVPHMQGYPSKSYYTDLSSATMDVSTITIQIVIIIINSQRV